MTTLQERLRLMVVTKPEPACGRSLPQVVAECVEAGATAIELRDKSATARELLEQADPLTEVVRAAGALFVVNDRLDVALACGADGVHLGPEDIPVAAAREVVPPGFLIGYSTDDPVEAATAAEDSADYLGVGAVYGTRSKEGLANEAIGPARVAEVLAAAGLPGVGIGGITSKNAQDVVRTGAGIAVLGAVMDAPRPADAVRELLRATGW
jgi:thiamine-phosphate diphosphorylase